MKARKIAALLLAVLLLVSCMPVMAENTPEATVEVTSAPVQITPEPIEEPTEAPAETSTETPAEEPVMLMSEEVEDEVTPEPEVPATEVPASEVPATEAPATEVPATEVPVTEVPATEVPATEVPATEVPATEVPATEAPATEVPATEAPATEVPATEVPATEVPATEAPVYEPVYAVIPGDTKLFADRELNEIFGELTGSEVLYVVEENAEAKLFAAIFDTEESIETASVETAYFRAEEELEWLDEAETEKALETMKTFRKADGEFVPYIDFKYPEPDPTEVPTEEPTVEPTETPVVDENGLIIEDLATIEPEITPEVTDTPAVDEDGLIIEELVPAEPTEEIPAEGEDAVVDSTVEETPADGDTEEAPFEDLPSVEDVLLDATAPEETIIESAPETAAPECSVVASMYGSSETVSMGDTVTVKAELIGYEGLTYTCEWECAATDETGAVIGEWQTTGITELEHSFVLDETTAQLAWRLRTVVEA